MQYCPKCKVSVTGAQEVCPLCQGDLRGAPDEKNIFPSLADRPDKKTGFIFRLMLFIAITAAIVCVAINIMVPTSAWWSLFVVFGHRQRLHIGRRGVFEKIGYYEKYHLAALYHAGACRDLGRRFGLARLVDRLCIFPSSGTVAIASMFVVGKVMNIPINDYIIYIIVDAVLGIIPIIFLCTGILHVIYPQRHLRDVQRRLRCGADTVQRTEPAGRNHEKIGTCNPACAPGLRQKTWRPDFVTFKSTYGKVKWLCCLGH